MSFLAAFLAVVSAGVFAAHILDALRNGALVSASAPQSDNLGTRADPPSTVW
ncbi:hypothetical protein QA641_27405 [Bradyrhizobium sp. CB1650]|uniref:hypothetical protein n=1 Tax=Bradyrhizobium sp. CB1650 TaxID=3039153 RepID=UPI002435290B|nr:hypothetical protein [Bradyrhizobium sp. CB1650]WGD49355.1 hypothetical protein QA641_27405 [Bradyrhizobium sp. CB1650]